MVDFCTLNEEQRNAVETNDSRVLVLAGPGTGKTKTLTSRIAHLIINRNVAAKNILALTFTKKAAEEMQTRVSEILKNNGISDMPQVCTFHSFAFQLIIDATLTEKKVSNNTILKIPELIDEDRLNVFYEEFCEEKKVKLFDISKLKNEMISADEYEMLPTHDPYILEAYRAYDLFLKTEGKIDYEDLLLICAKELENNMYFQGLAYFTHILVDEYQDTCPVQDKLINLLLKIGKNTALFAVGDDDQAIYGFRGCSSQIMLDFQTKYPGSKLYELSLNYRSQRMIVQVANAIIKHNMNRYAKELTAMSDQNEPISIYEFASVTKQATFVANAINDLVGNGDFSYSDFAILVRFNKQLESYESAFASNGIPYIFSSIERLLKRSYMQDLIAYLKVVSGQFADDDLIRILNTPKRSIGPDTVAQLINHATCEKKSLFSVMENAEEFMAKAKASRLMEFCHMIKKVRMESLSIKDRLQMILDDTQYIKYIETMLYAEIQKAEYNNNVKQTIKYKMDEIRLHIDWLMEQAGKYDASNENNNSVSDFIRKLRIGGMDDTINISSDRVSVITMHRAKGLEWPITFLDVNGVKADEYTAEERRVFYVACTRAKENICLLHTMSQPLIAGVRDIPRNCFSEYDDHNNFKCSELKQNYSVGSIVEHEAYGQGIIIESTDWIINHNSMPGKKLRIKFRDKERMLYTEFALLNLQEEGTDKCYIM